MLANMGEQKDKMQSLQLAFLQQEQQQTKTMMAFLKYSLLPTNCSKFVSLHTLFNLLTLLTFNSRTA